MTDRYTIKDVENRVESVNRRLERYGSPYRVKLIQMNGHVNLYETKADETHQFNHITAGTKREIAHYLSAMMRGIDYVHKKGGIMPDTILFTVEALRQANINQISEVLYQTANPAVSEVKVFTAMGGLPDSYISVEITYKSGMTINGGIDREGNLST